MTNPTVDNSKLSFSQWIAKVVCHTCTVVNCRLMLWLDMEGWKTKSETKLKNDKFAERADPAVYPALVAIMGLLTMLLLRTGVIWKSDAGSIG